jgi:hypothetical protein
MKQLIKSIKRLNHNLTYKIERAIQKDHSLQPLWGPCGEKFSVLEKMRKYIPPFKQKIIELTVKEITINPLNLTYNVFTNQLIPYIKNYYATVKINGIRCIIFIDNFTVSFLTDKEEITLQSNIKNINVTIIDSELVENTLYPCDIIVQEGEIIYHLPFYKRLLCLKKTFSNVKKILNEIGYNCKMKHYQKLYKTQYKSQVLELKNNTNYPSDGIIFIQSLKDYYSKKIFKWKPPEYLSIDFLIIDPKEYIEQNLKKKDNFKLYYLFCGISSKEHKKVNIPLLKNYDNIMKDVIYTKKFYPIQFTYSSKNIKTYLYFHPLTSKITAYSPCGAPVGKKLDKHIGEFRLEYNKWVLLKLRPDKDILVNKGKAYGNYYTVSKDLYKLMTNPITFDIID